MREFILDSVTKRQRFIPRHMSTWDNPDEDEDSAPAPSSRRRAHMRNSTLTSSSSCGWDDSVDTSGSQKTGSSQSGSRRRRSRPLPQESRASCLGRRAVQFGGGLHPGRSAARQLCRKNLAEDAAL